MIRSHWNPRCLQEVITNCDNPVAFLFRQLKHKVFWKAILVPLDRLIQRACVNSIQLGKMSVNHHLLTAKKEDPLLDDFSAGVLRTTGI